MDRFWSKVLKLPPPVDVPSDAPSWKHFPCWLWTGAKITSGYGSFGVSTKNWMRAHRYAFEVSRGPIPPGLQLDHLCRNRACVNPDHLDPVNNRENTLRGLGPILAAQRQLVKTHCPQGHPYDEANTYHCKKKLNRMCKACHRAHLKAYRERQRA